jgi:hypothetical protein
MPPRGAHSRLDRYLSTDVARRDFLELLILTPGYRIQIVTRLADRRIRERYQYINKLQSDIGTIANRLM